MKRWILSLAFVINFVSVGAIATESVPVDGSKKWNEYVEKTRKQRADWLKKQQELFEKRMAKLKQEHAKWSKMWQEVDKRAKEFQKRWAEEWKNRKDKGSATIDHLARIHMTGMYQCPLLGVYADLAYKTKGGIDFGMSPDFGAALIASCRRYADASYQALFKKKKVAAETVVKGLASIEVAYKSTDGHAKKLRELIYLAFYGQGKFQKASWVKRHQVVRAGLNQLRGVQSLRYLLKRNAWGLNYVRLHKD